MTSRVATGTLLLTLIIQQLEGFQREVKEHDYDDSFSDNLDVTSMRSTYDKIFQVFSYCSAIHVICMALLFPYNKLVHLTNNALINVTNNVTISLVI